MVSAASLASIAGCGNSHPALPIKTTEVKVGWKTQEIQDKLKKYLDSKGQLSPREAQLMIFHEFDDSKPGHFGAISSSSKTKANSLNVMQDTYEESKEVLVQNNKGSIAPWEYENAAAFGLALSESKIPNAEANAKVFLAELDKIVRRQGGGYTIDEELSNLHKATAEAELR